MRLEQAMIFVRDLERMTAFYRDVVGLPPNEATRLADWVAFEGNGMGLASTPCRLWFRNRSKSLPRSSLENSSHAS